MKLKQQVEPADLDRRAPAAEDEVLRAGRLERGGEQPGDHGRCAPSNVQRSACIRPDSALVSKTRSAMIAGTSASANATGENHVELVQQHERQRVDDQPDHVAAERDDAHERRRDRGGPRDGQGVRDEVQVDERRSR